MAANSHEQAVLDKAAAAVRGAADTVQSTTESIVDAVERSRRPGGLFDVMSQTTRDAPLRSLALAFLVGWLVARRR